jgi:hypothetical protein
MGSFIAIPSATSGRLSPRPRISQDTTKQSTFEVLKSKIGVPDQPEAVAGEFKVPPGRPASVSERYLDPVS